MAKKKSKKDKEDKIKKIGTILGILALILLVGGVIFVFGSRGSSHDIEISLETNREVSKGIPLELEFNINNETNEPLKNSELTVRLESGFIDLDFEGDKSVYRKSLNSLGEGTLTKEKVRVLPVGSIGEEYEVKASLDYSIGSASFEKNFSKKIKIENQPIELSIEKPDQILAGSSFETKITYENKSEFDFPELELQVQYPSSFNFISANLNPTSLNNTWNLGALKSGSKGEISIRGNIQNGGSEGSSIVSIINAEFLDEVFEVAREESELVSSQSPLDVDLSVSGAPRPGNRLAYRLDYENKSGVALRDVLISSELAGEMFNLKSIDADGNINTLGNQIVWNENTNPDLEILEPGESGTITFFINLKNSFPIRRLSDKNFELVVNTEIKSPTVPYYIKAEETSASEQLKTKVEGRTTIDAQAFYRDAGSGFVNEGSLPPEVGETTQFTVHWEIANYSTDIENVEIKAELPKGVGWAGQVKSNIDSVPLYNKDEKSIVWNIDEITATRGVISRPIEAVFQIELNPKPEFRGSYHPLVLETILTAEDRWTNKSIEEIHNVLSTSLPDDNTTSASQGIVQ